MLNRHNSLIFNVLHLFLSWIIGIFIPDYQLLKFNLVRYKVMNNVFSILSTVPDPRHGNRLTYPIDYLLLIAFSALMSGFKTWNQFALYAELHKSDLKKVYKRLRKKELRSYTPSHDTFSYTFSALDPEKFREAFTNWISEIFQIAGQHIAIDGKTVRGVKNIIPDADAHVVTAYLSGIKLALNEVFISKKSNEINAIKELFELIDIKDNVITIDAIGTQKDIVDIIREREGDYVLNVKANQPGTLFELEEHFTPFYKDEIIKNTEETSGHGRVETRVMESIVDPLRFADIEQYKSLDKWKDIMSIHKLMRTRYDKSKGTESTEISYYISSLKECERVFKMIRSHWAIENNLHYCLDVLFNEDQSLRRKDNSAKNVNIMYKIALFFLERLRSQKKRTFDAYQKINALKEPSQILETDYGF